MSLYKCFTPADTQNGIFIVRRCKASEGHKVGSLHLWFLCMYFTHYADTGAHTTFYLSFTCLVLSLVSSRRVFQPWSNSQQRRYSRVSGLPIMTVHTASEMRFNASRDPTNLPNSPLTLRLSDSLHLTPSLCHLTGADA